MNDDLISRQAAIEALETMRHIWARHIRAIELLPPVTPQEHGRLIDADKLLQEFFNVAEEEWTTPEIRAILKNAPPVEPEQRPKGEWIFNPKDAIDSIFAKPKCSNCGFESADGGNFCSNCGARMKGGDKE